MKTLGFAMTFALMSSAAQAGAVFEVPINGGMARIQLGDDCGQPVCASVSWNENEPRHIRKEQRRKKAPRPPASANSETAPAAASATGHENSASVTGSVPQSQSQANASGIAASEETPAPARRDPEPQAPPPAPVEEPKAEALLTPPQPAVSAAKANSPIGEWLAEGGEARIRIEECGKNLCGVVSAAKNANETDRKNPNPRLRSRPILGLPVLIDMKPVERNLWEGRIYNAKNGQTYMASISLDDPQTLRVEGCAFGGLICGDRSWTRVN